MASSRKVVLYYPKLADERRGIPPGRDVLPLSVLQIAGWPDADGYEVVLVDGNLYDEEQAHRRVVEACEGALLLGVTGILGYQVSDGMHCAERVRARHPRLPRVAGGWFPGVTPELHVAGGLYDAVVLGQGEITFRELVQATEAGEPWDGIPGLALWREGGLRLTAHRPVVGWNELRNCPWHLLDFEPYRAEQLRQRTRRLVERLPRPPWIPDPQPYVGICYFSSFGCPEPCAFCCSPGFTGQRWKAMPAERVLDDVCALQERWKFDVLRFHDANFGVHEERARLIAEGLLARGVRIGWFPMMQAYSILRYAPSTLDALAASGLYVVNIGGEAGDEATMARIGKHTNPGDNLRAAQELDRRGVGQWMTYILGYPHESADSMLATLEEVRQIRSSCRLAHPAIWPYRPIPGTPFFDQAVELGYRPPATLEAWGTIGEYHLDETWPGKIPDFVARRRRLFQHWSTLARGLARGRIGFWERRARKRLESGDYRFARTEAKAFDLYFRLSRLWDPSARGRLSPEWEQGDGNYRARSA
jgi:radical SAM superfamily enzyme YgiQ (UPF0313 family)